MIFFHNVTAITKSMILLQNVTVITNCIGTIANSNIFHKSCGRQWNPSNTLKRSSKSAVKIPPLSRLLIGFSITASKHCYALNPFQNLHWYFENESSLQWVNRYSNWTHFRSMPQFENSWKQLMLIYLWGKKHWTEMVEGKTLKLELAWLYKSWFGRHWSLLLEKELK